MSLCFFPLHHNLSEMFAMKCFFGACQLSIAHLLPMQCFCLHFLGYECWQKIDVVLSFYNIGEFECVLVEVVFVGPAADWIFVLFGLPHSFFLIILLIEVCIVRLRNRNINRHNKVENLLVNRLENLRKMFD